MFPEDRLESLLTAVRGGSDLETACHYAGLSSVAVHRLLEAGMIASQLATEGVELNDSDTAGLELWQAITKARADSVVRNVALIQKAAQDGSWQAAAWYLERAVPNAYGKPKPQAVTATELPKQLPEGQA